MKSFGAKYIISSQKRRQSIDYCLVIRIQIFLLIQEQLIYQKKETVFFLTVIFYQLLINSCYKSIRTMNSGYITPTTETDVGTIKVLNNKTILTYY